MRVHSSAAMVFLCAFLALAVLEFQSGAEVDHGVATTSIRCAKDVICPAPVCPGEVLGVRASEKAAIQLSEDMCHVQGLRPCKVPARVTSLLHLVENPLVVREGGLNGRPCPEQRWQATLALHGQ